MKRESRPTNAWWSKKRWWFKVSASSISKAAPSTLTPNPQSLIALQKRRGN
ncbi:hypothetical protein PGH45_18600 [Legionella pneumophila]|nr:hypothetical protein [Legionella pneumophila]